MHHAGVTPTGILIKTMNKVQLSVLLLFSLMLSACNSTDTPNDSTPAESTTEVSAMITAVSFTGEPGNYTFSVTIKSPDTGCGQYADWWEILRPNGELIYRRILAHSHVVEQPFTRNGGPVNINSDEDIIVRAHMNSSGFGEQVFTGTIVNGLGLGSLDASFAAELEIADPLPATCAF